MRLLAFAAVLLSSSGAFAQSAGAQAEILFRQGRDLMAAGKIAEACSSFQESQKLEPTVATLLNLAACREKNGQLATAWGLFLDAERQTRSATSADRQLHDSAAKRAASLEARVSKLEIDVPDASKVDGLEIKRDNERIGSATWNRALPVDGGTYTISASAPDSQTWSTQITIANEHDSKKVEIPKLTAAPAQVTAAPTTTISNSAARTDLNEQRSPSSGPSRAVPIAIGAGALVLLGGALTFDLWGDSTYSDAKAETTNQARRDDLYNSANTKRYTAIGLGVAGVAAGGVAVWMLLRGGEHEADETAIHVVPTLNGLAIGGIY